MPNVVIFDFDGTIADTKEVTYHVYLALAERHGIEPMTAEDLDRLGGLSIRQRLKEHGVSVLKLPRLVRESIPVYRSFMAKADIFPDVKAMLNRLADNAVTLAIVSSNNVANIERFLDEHDIDCFEHIVGKASLFGKHKKIGTLLKRLRLDPKKAIYVGDELRDVEAARRAKTCMAAVTWGYDQHKLLKTAAPDFIAHTPKELENIILEWAANSECETP